MSGESIAVPIPRQKRKRPWSPRTRYWFVKLVGTASFLIVCLLYYGLPDTGVIWRVFYLFGAAIMALIVRFEYSNFRRSRDQDENGD